jgi:spore coat polysaccharide biosynthesis protein SpsF
MLLQHVIDACENSAHYLNRKTSKSSVLAEVALIIPHGDEIREKFPRAKIYEGSELDVLSRYYNAAVEAQADYVVRVTGDCPLIDPAIITKHINTCLLNDHDYVSNVQESIRTVQDGLDCEVFTMALLKKAYDKAVESSDREHVTTWIRRQPDISCGHVMARRDTEDYEKLSVDTPEDLERVIKRYEKLQNKRIKAELNYGKKALYEY